MVKKRISNILFYLSLAFILLAFWNDGNPYFLAVSIVLLVIYKFVSNSIEFKKEVEKKDEEKI